MLRRTESLTFLWTNLLCSHGNVSTHACEIASLLMLLSVAPQRVKSWNGIFNIIDFVSVASICLWACFLMVYIWMGTDWLVLMRWWKSGVSWLYAKEALAWFSNLWLKAAWEHGRRVSGAWCRHMNGEECSWFSTGRLLFNGQSTRGAVIWRIMWLSKG